MQKMTHKPVKMLQSKIIGMLAEDVKCKKYVEKTKLTK